MNPAMDRGSRIKMWAALALAMVFSILLMTDVARDEPVDQAVRRTEPIRVNLARLRKVALSVERNLETLHGVNETQQVQAMNDAVAIFKDYLLPYLSAKEEALYPRIDQLFPGSPLPFTLTMRQEHQILRRWIDDMQSMADQPMPDPHAFVRKGERLLGLLEGHFEVEETILLPLLDQPMEDQSRFQSAKQGGKPSP